MTCGKGEVADALSRWTFGQATPRDGDRAVLDAHLAELERKFNAWVKDLSRQRLEALAFSLGLDPRA